MRISPSPPSYAGCPVETGASSQGYSDLVTTLGEAGFVILPKRPTAKMIGAVTLWDYANGEGATSDDVAEIYGEMVNAALKE